MKKTFAILGCGKLGTIVAHAWKNDLLPGYELIGAYSRSADKRTRLTQEYGGRSVGSYDGLLALQPDFLVETASVQALRDIAVRALHQGTSLIPLSVGAFADTTFYRKAKDAAVDGQARIYIPSGAVGGFDVLQTIALMADNGVTPDNPLGRDAADPAAADVAVSIHTQKGPASLQNTPLYDEALLQEAEKDVLDGTAAEAIRVLPTKVNVAVAAALASLGPDQTKATITSRAGFQGDDHCIHAQTEGIKATLDIYSSTSAIAGWSVVALMRNIASPVRFF